MDVEHWKTGHGIYFLKLKAICNDFILHEWKSPRYLTKYRVALSSTSCLNESGVEKWEEHKKGGCL